LLRLAQRIVSRQVVGRGEEGIHFGLVGARIVFRDRLLSLRFLQRSFRRSNIDVMGDAEVFEHLLRYFREHRRRDRSPVIRRAFRVIMMTAIAITGLFTGAMPAKEATCMVFE